MTSPIQQTIQVAPIHRSLLSLLTRFHKSESSNSVDHSASNSVLEEIDMFDFGVKYKVLLLQTSGGNRTILRVSIPGWKEIQACATRRLQAIYGDSVCVMADNDINDKENETYDFSVRVEDAMENFDSIESCAASLSQIRIQVAGAPIFDALERIASHENGEMEEYIHALETHPRCGTCHCMSTSEKTMIIFIADFEDEMERALARLFLQQFAGAQKQISTSPHCEFRRSNEPPKEVLNLIRTKSHSYNPVGYMSFTFFPSHVKTAERRQKAVELMVNFFPYLDRHVKSTKSYMHSRMRTKKDDLLCELKASSVQKGVGTLAKNGKTQKNLFVAARKPRTRVPV